MRKRFGWVTLVIVTYLLVFGVLINSPRVGAFSGSGSGTSVDPYRITTPAELADMSNYLGSGNANVYFELMNDIDLNVAPYNTGSGWTPIGLSSGSSSFYGKFDGSGYTISNLLVDRTGTYAGLFGYTTGATIENITISNADVTASSGYSGVLVGRASTSTTITGATVAGTVSTPASYAGGLVGYLDNSHISDSSSSVNADANQSVGSAIGYISASNNTSSIVENTSATGNVRVTQYYAGGFVGGKIYGTITNSYATGTVLGDQSGGTANTYSAGFVGNFCYGLIQRSYATGDVYGADDLGGFFARSHNCGSSGIISDSYARGDIYPSAGQGGAFGAYIYLGSIVRSYATGTVNGGQTNGGFIYWSHTCSSCSDNFWDTETTGQSTGGALNSGSPTGKTSAEMKSVATFTDTATVGLTNPWDFVNNPNDDVGNNDYWDIGPTFNDGYPYLSWQSTNQTPNDPDVSGSDYIDGAWQVDNTPLFSFWMIDADNSDQLRYQIQIDDSSDFGSPVIDYTSGPKSQGSFNFFVGQAEGEGTSGVGGYSVGSESQTLSSGQYYWRVRAIDDQNTYSNWTTANASQIAFGVDTQDPLSPSAPSTVSPSANYTPTWQWSDSEDNESGLANPTYTIQWSSDISFGSGINSATTNNTEYTHSTQLSGGTWYARVTATDNAGNTETSSIGSVVIDSGVIDSDTDGASDYVENQSPNNGDANGDGTADSDQDFVASFINPITGKYVVLETTNDCFISAVSMIDEADGEGADEGHDYTNGLMDFTLTCDTQGHTATISQYYFDVQPPEDGFIFRKYNRTAQSYGTIKEVGFTAGEFLGEQTVIATYQVTDGGELDEDGIANGTIVDPAGLAQIAGSLSSTGQNIGWYVTLALVLIAGGALTITLYELRQRSRI